MLRRSGAGGTNSLERLDSTLVLQHLSEQVRRSQKPGQSENEFPCESFLKRGPIRLDMHVVSDIYNTILKVEGGIISNLVLSTQYGHQHERPGCSEDLFDFYCRNQGMRSMRGETC